MTNCSIFTNPSAVVAGIVKLRFGGNDTAIWRIRQRMPKSTGVASNRIFFGVRGLAAVLTHRIHSGYQPSPGALRTIVESPRPGTSQYRIENRKREEVSHFDTPVSAG
ncbi:MAG TPA: hypothetical protein DCG12_16705 [Planctomycetaceae bacterium]|nr:hypothetical protein [Planctomycetaceae bacterium]